MNHPERLLTELPGRVADELPARVAEIPERLAELPGVVGELPERLGWRRSKSRPSTLKRVFLFVVVLGVAGAVVALIRARRSQPASAPGDWRVTNEDDESAPPMRVREAGSASA